MRDSRVTILNPTTISADGATNGANIDLLGDYTGDHLYGTSEYGLGVEIILSDVVTGTGDGFTVTFKWQVADDSSGAPGTWIDNAQIGVVTLDTDGNVLKEDGTTELGLTRAKLQTRLRTAKAWARIVATAAGITGGETCIVKAFLSDGTLCFADTGVIS